MASKFVRLSRHVITTKMAAQRMFPLDTQQRLQQTIAYGEAQHRAELQLIIEAALPLRKVLAGVSTRQRALQLFDQYRVSDTKEKNGVLLYINLADRRAELIADSGATQAIPNNIWQNICDTMLSWFKRDAFEHGTINAINSIHTELRRAFPARNEANQNELPDAPVML